MPIRTADRPRPTLLQPSKSVHYYNELRNWRVKYNTGANRIEIVYNVGFMLIVKKSFSTAKMKRCGKLLLILLVVCIGCALPCGATGSSRPASTIDGLWGVNYNARVYLASRPLDATPFPIP